MNRYKIALFLAFFGLFARLSAQCGLDVYIAVDQSGSIDEVENAQGREFISQLMRELDPWGTANNESRMAIAQWSSSGEWMQYAFPSAGTNYTTKLEDVLAYQNSPRIYDGGTDPYQALLKSYQVINQTPISGRTAPKLLILMTDAYCSQIQSNITSLATQIKADGIYVMVLAIDAAQSCAILQGENVADAGGYFSATSYDELQLKALAYVEDIIDAGCVNSAPKFDLTINLTNYTASNCVGNAGTYKVDYSINNVGNLAWSNPITISFYDGDPTLSSTNYLTKQVLGSQTIAPNGSMTGSLTSNLLSTSTQLYAIINFDGSILANAPPLPLNIKDKLLIVEERRGNNNISAGKQRTSDISCTPKPIVQVGVQAGVIGCDNTVSYEVELCNTGDASANIDSLIPIKPHPNFVLKNSTNIVDSTVRRIWGTYYGGSHFDFSNALSIDAQGNIYMAGQTNSDSAISTSGSHQEVFGGNSDGFLVKFNSSGVRQWATYYGGSHTESVASLSIDAQGNIYMTGYTNGTNAISTSGSHQEVFGGGYYDAFLVKFNPYGIRQWATYYGGTGEDRASSLSTDAQGNIYMAGRTNSDSAISTPGSHQEVYGRGNNDGFLVKFNSSGVRQWATYYGGSDEDVAIALSTDAQGNIYMAGYTESTNTISTLGSHQATFGGGDYDAFLVKFNSSGVRQWATYYGGSNSDYCRALSTDAQGNIYMAGETHSNSLISTPGSHQEVYGGGYSDAFLVKLNSSGVRQWATYYGGSISDYDYGSAVSTDAQGNIFMTGYTKSTNAISTSGSHQAVIGGGVDAFLVKFNSSGVRQWATYYGGINTDYTSALSTDTQGNIYIAGKTYSTNAISTSGSQQSVYGGRYSDGFLVKFNNSGSIILAPGECKTIQYTYTYNNVPPGTYNFSVSVATSQTPILILPDSNFTAGGVANLDGFNGAVHTSDNITITGNTPACPTGDQVKVAVSIPAVSGCGSGNYAQATVTITNTSGITILNPSLYLNLTGTGSKFAGELYNFTNNLKIPAPNILSPSYPNVPYALYGKSGEQRLPIWELPNGTSTLQLDIDLGTTLTNLAVRIDTIPTTFNDSGKTNLATDAQGVTIPALPTISGFSCPSSITAGNSITYSGIATTNATSVLWASSTQANIPNGGTVNNPSLVYTPNGIDLANGYVAISLTAYNSGGCEVTRSCQIAINSVLVDYGDAPKTYDLNSSTKPIAGSSTLQTGIHLGSIAPGTETTAKNSTTALGDGTEEDGLEVATCGAKPANGVNYPLTVKATNATTTKAYINAFADWNNDGDYLDEGETALKLKEATVSSGTKNYTLDFKPVSPNTTVTQYFIRLRISTDSNSIKQPYETAPNGEVEDHLMKTGQILSQQSFRICQGDTLKINGVNYTASGTFSDTLTSSSGCDSILTLIINVSPKYNRSQTVAICPGGSYTIGTHTYTQAGVYKDTLKTVYNCDSIVNTTITLSTAPSAPAVTVTQPTCTTPTGTVTITAVSGNTYSFDGGTYSTTLIYSGLAGGSNHTVKAKNAAGCESPITNVSINTAPQAPSAPAVTVTQPTCTTPTGSVTITAVSGNTYSFDGGTYSTALIYSGLAGGSNHTVKAKNAAGCESPVTNVSINTAPQIPLAPAVTVTQPTCTTPTGTVTITAVSGNTYSFDGGTYSTTLIYSGLAGGSNHTVKAKNAAGCESSVTNVSINTAPQAPTAPAVTVTQPTCTTPTGTVTITAVSGNTYSFDGGTYSTTLIYSGLAGGSNHTVKAKNAAGCESPVTNVSINTAPQIPLAPAVTVTQPTCTTPTGTVTITAVSGNTYSFDGGTYSATLIYSGLAGGSNHTVKAKNAAGCESPVTNVSINTAPLAPAPVSQQVSICPNGSYTIGTQTYTQAGTYKDTLRSIANCDSIVTTILSVTAYQTNSQQREICQGAQVVVGNHVYTQSGIYTDTINGLLGCDTILTTRVTVYPVYNRQQSAEICSGDVFLVGNQSYTQTGTYKDTLQTIHGCDSIIETSLLVHPTYSKTNSVAICSGAVYQVGNSSYNSAGVYSDTFQTAKGCDSIIITQLTVNAVYDHQIQAVICPNGSYTVGNNTYTAAGQYVDTLGSIFGCDSIIRLSLSVSDTIKRSIATTICSGDSVQLGNNYYSQAGVYTESITTLSGCDSVVTMTLTVLEPVYSQIDTAICSGEQVLIGSESFGTSGTYEVNIPRQGLCDSIITLDLSVLEVPQFNAQSDSVEVYAGSSVQLSVTPELENVNYSWTPIAIMSNPSISNPTATIVEDTWIYVEVTNLQGCSRRDSIQIMVRSVVNDCEEDNIFLPNAFTPNGDKQNDVYRAKFNVALDEMHLMIFDRWGKLVFETTDPQVGWDGNLNGKPSVADVYGYIFEGICNGEKISIKGQITLIR